MRNWIGFGVAALVVVAACGRAETPPAGEEVREEAAADPAVEAEMEAARARILSRADSVRDALQAVPGLSRQERAALRRDVNARQIATARSLGVRAGSDSEIDRLTRRGRLVELEDTTEYWVLRDLEHSVPFVTPDTRAMLVEIGRRFHARLDSLGLPRYRMEVTSVLRTPETQAKLRNSNANASRGVSAHEFGTTLDVAHVRFAAPADAGLVAEVPASAEWTASMRQVEALVLEQVARKHAAGLQGVLGRVLLEMREEQKLRVMMERRQAVYHMTVARRFPGG